MHNLALSAVAPPIGMPHLPAFDPVVSGGYHRVPASQLMAVLSSLSAKVITARHLRIYAGTLAMVASREAAKSEAPPQFTPDELLRLLGSKRTPHTRKRLRADLRHLERIGLVVVSEAKIGHARNLEALDPTEIPEYQRLEAIYGDAFFRNHRRMVPVPRRILRAIARGEFTPTMARMATVEMLRCLYWHKGTGYRTDGRYKVTEAAKLCGVSHSAAKTARRKLIEIGWLVPDDSLRQLQLNRAGVRDRIAIDWGEGAKPASRSTEAVHGSDPPPVEAVHGSAPPVRQISLSQRDKHQISNPSQGTEVPEPPPRQRSAVRSLVVSVYSLWMFATLAPGRFLRELESPKTPEEPGIADCLDSQNEKEEKKITTAAHHRQKADSVDVPQLRSNGRSKTTFKYEISHTATGTFEEEAPPEAPPPEAPREEPPREEPPPPPTAKPAKRPHIDIEEADLEDPEAFRERAIAVGWIDSSEEDRLRLYSCAIAARESKSASDPCALFRTLLLEHRPISKANMEKARRAIRKIDGAPPTPEEQREIKEEATREARRQELMARKPVERPLMIDAEESEFTRRARKNVQRFGGSDGA